MLFVLHRESFLNELDRIIYYVVTQYINTVTADLTLPPEDRELFIRFYKCTLTGIFLHWLNAGMEYDLSAPFMRICCLFDDAGKQAFQTGCGKKKKGKQEQGECLCGLQLLQTVIVGFLRKKAGREGFIQIK